MIAGADPADATSATEPVADYAAALTGDMRGLRIGVPLARSSNSGVDAEVAARLQDGARDARRRAARHWSTSSCRTPEHAIPVYYLVATAEASSNLARYDGVRYGFRATGEHGQTICGTMYARTREQGFGAEVKRRIMLGTYVLSAGYYDAYYLKAQQVRTLIRRDYDHAFEQRRRRGDADQPDAGLQDSASASPIRCRCTWPTSSPSARTWRGLPADQRAVRLHRRRHACRSDCS